MRETNHRSWTNFTNYNPSGDFNIKANRRTHIEGLVKLIDGRIVQGWSPSLLTFQFRQLPERAGAILHQMKTEIEAVYRKLVCRVQRFPTTRVGSINVPILFACADFPIPKHKKKLMTEVTVNEGCHFHGVMLVPPTSRLKTDLASHFADERLRYLKASRLSSIYAEPIEDNLERVC